MTLLVLHQTPLKSFLYQDLVSQYINYILLPLCMVVKVILNLSSEHEAWKIVSLQGLNQIYNLDVIVLVVAPLSKVDKLLALLSCCLLLLQVLALKFIFLVAI